MDSLLVDAKTSAGERTREALILAGERLFAQHGIDAVSLRQINAAAGQKNSSAAHYHFGSKEALLLAVFEYRMERVNARRLDRLQRLCAEGGQPGVRAIVEAIVYPIVEESREAEGGEYYIRFLAQMIGHPQSSLDDLWGSRFAEGATSAIRLLRRALPNVPETLLGQRFGLMWEQAIHALADREKLSRGATGGRAGRRTISPALFVSNLCDMIAGGLAAGVSPETRHQSGHAEPRDYRARQAR